MCESLTRWSCADLGRRSHQQLPNLPMERHQSLVLRCGGTLKPDGTQSSGTHLVPRDAFYPWHLVFSAQYFSRLRCVNSALNKFQKCFQSAVPDGTPTPALFPPGIIANHLVFS